MRRSAVIFIGFVMAFTGFAVTEHGRVLAQTSGAAAGAARARATLADASGQTVGEASFEQTPHGVLLQVSLRSAKAGTHALHIHETGRCDAPGFQSAGGHFAPRGTQHGFLNASGHHTGDLPNVHVPDSGTASMETFIAGLRLVDGDAPLLDADGASLVLHESSDDYRSDPAGNAGGRIACGVIAR